MMRSLFSLSVNASLLSVLFLALVACSPQLSEKYNTVFFTSNVPETMQLEASQFVTIPTDSMKLAQPSHICAMKDGKVAFVENLKEDLVWIVDTRTGNFVSCVQKGRGPGEASAIQNLWCEEGQLGYACAGKIGRVAISEFPLKVTSEDVAHLNLRYLRAIPIGVEDYLVQILSQNCRLARVNAKGEIKDTVGVFPMEDMPKDFKFNNAQFQSFIAVSPDKKHVAQACMSWNKIEIYNNDKHLSLSNILAGPIEIDSKIVERTLPMGTQWVQKPFWDMFRCVSATNEAFYVGYIGQEGLEEQKDINTIYAFDWSGNLLRKICLPFEIEWFDIDAETNTLYAIVSNPDTHLVMTKIPV